MSDTVDDILYQNFCLWTNPCLFNYVLQHLSIRKIPMSSVARIIIRHELWCNYQQYTLISIQRIRESKEIMPVARKHCQRYFLIGGTEKKQERIQQAASTCWINITAAATTIAKIKIPMSSAQFSAWLQPYPNVSLKKVNTKTCVFKFRDNAYFTNLLPSDDNVQKLLYMMNTKKKMQMTPHIVG